MAQQDFDFLSKLGVHIDPIAYRGEDGKSPYVGEDGCWYEYDDEAGEFRNTGIQSDRNAAERALEAAQQATAATASANSAAERAEAAADSADAARGDLEADHADWTGTVKPEIEAAIEAANSAAGTANTAAEEADRAKQSVDEAVNSASEALSNANEAISSANQAIEAANSAAEDAQAAVEAANQAKQAADDATASANSALESAERIGGEVRELQSSAESLLASVTETAGNVQTAVDAANAAAQAANTAAELADQAAERASNAAEGKGLQKLVVEELPEAGKMQDDTLYFAPAAEPQADSQYDVYMRIGDRAERIGGAASNNIGNAEVEFDYQTLYTGVHIAFAMPKVTVTLGGRQLSEGSDYVVLNTDPPVGEEERIIVVLGIGNYTGAVYSKWIYCSPVFGENSFKTIALVCDGGAVPESWKVGDVKENVSWLGETHSLQIIGKNQDNLHRTDVKYNTAYNNKSNKAALTLLQVDCHSAYYPFCRTLPDEYNWTNSDLKRETIEKSLLPQTDPELVDAIRTVSKYIRYSIRQPETYTAQRAETVFLLEEVEVTGEYAHSGELSDGKQYQYFAEGGSAVKLHDGTPGKYWLRCINKDQPDTAQGCYITAEGACDTFVRDELYHPANGYADVLNKDVYLVAGFCL